LSGTTLFVYTDHIVMVWLETIVRACPSELSVQYADKHVTIRVRDKSLKNLHIRVKDTVSCKKFVFL